jgi:hypothetical protein
VASTFRRPAVASTLVAGLAPIRVYSHRVASKRRLIRIPEDLSHAVDLDREASHRWSVLSRADREVLAWYVGRARTRWGRRKRTAEVLRMLRSGESVAMWQHAPPAAMYTDLYGSTVTLSDPPS